MKNLNNGFQKKKLSSFNPKNNMFKQQNMSKNDVYEFTKNLKAKPKKGKNKNAD
jgi:hypothetical protein